MQSKKKILIFIHFDTYFDNLFGVGKAIKGSEDFEPVLIFPQMYAKIQNHLSLCLSEGIVCIDPSGKKITSDTVTSYSFGPKKIKTKRLRSYIPAFIKDPINDLRRLFSRISFLKNRMTFVRNLIHSENISLIVLGGDIVGHDMPAIIKAGNLEKVPTMAVVSWLGEYEAASIYSSVPAHQITSIPKFLIAKIYSKWVHSYEDKSILRLPAPDLLALEWLDIAPPSPWILHSGFLDAIAVEGEEMRQAAIKMGLPNEKVFATGSIFNDQMAKDLESRDTIINKLYQQLDIPLGRPMLLSALPPDFLYAVSGTPQCPQSDFKNYRELVEFWIKSLAQVKNHNVVICLHPSTSYQDMKYIEEWGVKIALDKTSDLVPLCDLYVASISATINWAISCGVPVLNYDVYRYRYSDYLHAGGVITTEEQAEFVSNLQKLTSDSTYFDKFKDLQNNQKEKWAKLDGQSGQRILNVIQKLINN